MLEIILRVHQHVCDLPVSLPLGALISVRHHLLLIHCLKSLHMRLACTHSQSAILCRTKEIGVFLIGSFSLLLSLLFLLCLRLLLLSSELMLWHDSLNFNVGLRLRFGLILRHRLVYALSLLFLDFDLLSESSHVPIKDLFINKVCSPANVIQGHSNLAKLHKMAYHTLILDMLSNILFLLFNLPTLARSALTCDELEVVITNDSLLTLESIEEHVKFIEADFNIVSYAKDSTEVRRLSQPVNVNVLPQEVIYLCLVRGVWELCHDISVLLRCDGHSFRWIG